MPLGGAITPPPLATLLVEIVLCVVLRLFTKVYLKKNYSMQYAYSVKVETTLIQIESTVVYKLTSNEANPT